MRSNTKEWPREWRPWFAWYPVRASLPDVGQYRWVWLEDVEFRYTGYSDNPHEYRLPHRRHS
jgi:hypothetical protein